MPKILNISLILFHLLSSEKMLYKKNNAKVDKQLFLQYLQDNFHVWNKKKSFFR
jgi:hypothetical protein